MGVSLFMHSVRLVLGDWRTAMRISGLLYLIYAIPSLVLSLLFPQPQTAEEAGAAALASFPFTFVAGIFALVAFVWIAVSWHRYILLDEMPEGQFPPFNRSRMLSYAGYSLIVGGIGLAVAVAAGAVVGILAVIALPLSVFAALAALFAMLVVSYRLAPLLPAAAIGKPMPVGAAWQATKGANSAIIVLALVSAIAAIVIDLPGAVLSLGGGPGRFLATLWYLGTGWLKMVVGVSILTTIYGHYVEGRALSS